MFASMHGADPLPGTLVRLGIPVVCSGRPIGEAPVPYVDVDHFGGVCSAVRHLVAAGRRRIATIAGPQDMVAGIDRLAGYRATLEEAGLAQHVSLGDFTRESGIVAMRSLLADDPALDAVFVASDMMAHGALLALKDAGRRVPHDVAGIGFDDFRVKPAHDPPPNPRAPPTLKAAGRRVPHDVAVIGFDDFEISRYSDPPLTTVRQPIVEMGRTMARRLLGLIVGDPGQPAPVALPPELIIRGSA